MMRYIFLLVFFICCFSCDNSSYEKGDPLDYFDFKWSYHKLPTEENFYFYGEGYCYSSKKIKKIDELKEYINEGISPDHSLFSFEIFDKDDNIIYEKKDQAYNSGDHVQLPYLERGVILKAFLLSSKTGQKIKKLGQMKIYSVKELLEENWHFNGRCYLPPNYPIL